MAKSPKKAAAKKAAAKKAAAKKAAAQRARTPEALLGDVVRALAAGRFASLDEANAFLDDLRLVIALTGFAGLTEAAGEGALREGGAPAGDGGLGFGGLSAVDRAQDLMYTAWEERDPQRRVALARRALEISPDCADAYVLLADETARSYREEVPLYEQGVAAGERALGPAYFAHEVGHFWGLIETRPYMRARAGLARALAHTGRREEALAHYRDLLRLNPNDNQGLRYELVTLLLGLGRDDEAAALLDTYPDDGSAWWAYSRALWRFRRRDPAADAALDAALDQNPHVPTFVLDQRRIPKYLPDFYTPGDRSEAIFYALDGANVWRATRGALDWLRARAAGRGDKGLKGGAGGARST